ncbi:MAG: 4'-phosphopantetheinyl transferase superfamily protein [Neomegalonema sp.]|nr:4'-phosphopantetheinyl transferase superfamily protein [Neomegalonema sp.]
MMHAPAASLSALKNDQIHVWTASLQASSSELALARTWLSEPETERAERYRFEKDQRRFIIGRAWLRKCLGRYLDVDPGIVPLRTGRHGKPELPQELRFNLTRSSEHAMIALSWRRPLGVDLEIQDRERGTHNSAIADTLFSSSERRVLSQADPERAADLFLRLWTRKEALAKAHGEGLGIALHDLSIPLVESARPLEFSSLGQSWTLLPVEAPPQHCAALVAQGRFRAQVIQNSRLISKIGSVFPESLL